MSAALFGSTSRSTSKNLVEFRAGKMYMQGKMVHPDKRKGLVYIYQADDTLLHFCWKDRISGSVEEDLIVFPDDCEFKKVAQCTTGRVFVLRFKSNNRRLFFWMQEPSSDKDEEFLRKVNEHLNNIPTPGSGRSAASTPNPVLSGSDLPNLNSSELQNLIGNFSQHQLMQILGSGVPSLANLLGPNSGSGSGRGSSNSSSPSSASSANSASTTSTTSGSASTTTTSSSRTASATSGSTLASSDDSANRVIQLSDLQNILTGISGPPQATGEREQSPPVDLAASLTAETLQPILTNKDFIDKLKPFLPETGDQIAPADQLRGTVTSPQFQQAVNLFTAALQSGQLGPLISQFGLGEQAAAAAVNSNMEEFIKALSNGSKKEVEAKSEKEKEKEKQKDQDKDNDDSMPLD